MKINVSISIIILIFCFELVSAQNVELYLLQENIETLITNTENIIEDPFIIGSHSCYPGITEIENKFPGNLELVDDSYTENEWLNNLEINAEIGFSKTSKFIKMPVAYYYKDFEISLAIPLYFQKRVYYSHGYVSTYGVGDLMLSGIWNKKSRTIFNKASLNVTFPTGNPNKVSDGYLCPLGTGSVDFIFSNIFQFNKPKYGIYNNITYRYSGKSEKQVIVNYPNIPGAENLLYSIYNGHLLLVNTAANYNFAYFFTAFAGISVIGNSQGSFDKTQSYTWKDDIVSSENQTANQNFVYLDAKLALSFSFYDTDLVFVLSQPIYTKRNIANIEANRSLSYYIRLSRNIF